MEKKTPDNDIIDIAVLGPLASGAYEGILEFQSRGFVELRGHKYSDIVELRIIERYGDNNATHIRGPILLDLDQLAKIAKLIEGYLSKVRVTTTINGLDIGPIV